MGGVVVVVVVMVVEYRTFGRMGDEFKETYLLWHKEC